MRIALIGVSGSGKGEQARRLAKKYRIPHISTGDLLRELSRQEQLSAQDQHALEEGQMVSDEVVRELLEARLRKRDTKRGFVIDGYPRNIPQAQSLDNLLGMLGRPLQIAVYIEMEDAQLVKRNVGRQVCTDCGQIFNRYFSPPKEPDVCDHCGASLRVRRKDTPQAVEWRVDEHKKKTVPLITYFKAQHKLRTVLAQGSVDEIHQDMCLIVDLEVRPLETEAIVMAADPTGSEVDTVIAGGQINRIVKPTPPEIPAINPPRTAPARKSKQKSNAVQSTKTAVVRKPARAKAAPGQAGTVPPSSPKAGKADASTAAISTHCKSATVKNPSKKPVQKTSLPHEAATSQR